MKKLPYDRQVAMETLFTGHGPTTFKGKEHNLSRAYLVKLFLENADMPGVILDRSNLYQAWLAGCNLQGARLVSADLQGANLRGADLKNCRLNNANLANARLEGADLRGADLTRAKLQGAFLNDAKLDGSGQLESAASLHQVSGLPDAIKSELSAKRPGLFSAPENLENDPYYYLPP